MVTTDFDNDITYTTLLQEITQGKDKIVPEYKIWKEGPDHMPIVKAIVKVYEFQTIGAGPNKKIARQKAAHTLLLKMKEKLSK